MKPPSLLITAIAWLLPSGLFGAITNVTVQGTTSTQAIVSYTAPTASACTVEVSLESDYSPLVEDVDPVMYPGSDLDSRTGNISNGRSRIVIVGRRGMGSELPAIVRAANGHRKSRALRAETKYYGRITCGGDTATFEFTTANIPTGDTRGDALPTSPDYLWEYETVTANAAEYSEYADPYTGARIVRSTAYQNFGYGASSASWTDGSAPADCNKNLTGVVTGACLYTTATGSNWSASDAGTPASGSDLNHDLFWAGEVTPTITPVATAQDEFHACKVIDSAGTSAIAIDPGNTDATYTTAWTVERLR